MVFGSTSRAESSPHVSPAPCTLILVYGFFSILFLLRNKDEHVESDGGKTEMCRLSRTHNARARHSARPSPHTEDTPHARTPSLERARAQDRTRPPMHSLPHTQTTYIPIVALAASVSFGDCILAAHATHTAQLQFAPVRSRTHIPRTVRRASRTRTGERYMRYVALPMRVSACRSLHRWRGREATPSTLHTAHAASNRERRTTTTTPHKQNTLSPTPPTPDTPGTSSRVGICASPTPRPTQCGLAAAAAAPRVWPPRRRLLCRRARYKRILTPLGRPLAPIWCGPSLPQAPAARPHVRRPCRLGREREMRWRRALAAHLGGRRETSPSPQEWA